MAYVIQNIDTGKYLKHDGSTSESHPYINVDSAEEAEQYPTEEHAQFVAFWNVDMHKKWRVVKPSTGESWIRNKGGGHRWMKENTIANWSQPVDFEQGIWDQMGRDMTNEAWDRMNPNSDFYQLVFRAVYMVHPDTHDENGYPPLCW